MKLNSLQIARATSGAEVSPGPVGRIVTDTRQMRPGDWFWALRGPNFDGNSLADKALEAGCVGAVLEVAPADWDRGLVLVEDGLEALQACAASVRDAFDGEVVGITGSSGKTTTRAMIACILREAFEVHQTVGNLNNHIGVPLTILSAPEEAEVWVIEMGMSAAGEIDLLQRIGAPTIRLITNVSLAHSEGAGGLEQTAACKEELFAGSREGDLLVLNQDDPMVRSMRLPEGTRVVRFGSSADCEFELVEVLVDSAKLGSSMKAKTPYGLLDIDLPAPGRHIAMDALSAVAIAHALGVKKEAVLRGIESYKPVGMRMRIEEHSGGITVLNDAYNANPASTLASLRTLAGVEDRRRVALLGDMLELGEFEAQCHRELVEEALGSGVEILGFVGPRYRSAVESLGVTEQVTLADSSEEMGAWLSERIREGDVLLIKGSRGLAMERVLRALGLEES